MRSEKKIEEEEIKVRAVRRMNQKSNRAEKERKEKISRKGGREKKGIKNVFFIMRNCY